jgi:hypothetical protein
MPSTAEAIAARVAAVLLDNTPAGEVVYRDRDDAFTREESPAILVELMDEDTRPLGGGSGPFRPLAAVDEDQLRLAVTVAVRSANWQSVADAVRVAAHGLLVADAQLLQMAPGFRRDRTEWRAARADQPFGYCAQIYRFRYHTQAHNLGAAT